MPFLALCYMPFFGDTQYLQQLRFFSMGIKAKKRGIAPLTVIFLERYQSRLAPKPPT